MSGPFIGMLLVNLAFMLLFTRYQRRYFFWWAVGRVRKRWL